MSGLSTQFTSISEDLTCPPECRKSYVLTILGEDPKSILAKLSGFDARVGWQTEIAGTSPTNAQS